METLTADGHGPEKNIYTDNACNNADCSGIVFAGPDCDGDVYVRTDSAQADCSSGGDFFDSAACVIMASGRSRRFGSNKLMADFGGEPLIMRILKATDGIFRKRVLVTRYTGIALLAARLYDAVIIEHESLRAGKHALPDAHGPEDLSLPYALRLEESSLPDARRLEESSLPDARRLEELSFPDAHRLEESSLSGAHRPEEHPRAACGKAAAYSAAEGSRAAVNRERLYVILHDMPDKSDTIKSGLTEAISVYCPGITGCMFCTADQPLLKRETVTALLRASCSFPEHIIRPTDGKNCGSPVYFPSALFPELLLLKNNEGGGKVIAAHSDMLLCPVICSPSELSDADTPEELDRLRAVYSESLSGK